MEDRMYSNWSCALEGQMPERCIQHGGTYPNTKVEQGGS